MWNPEDWFVVVGEFIIAWLSLLGLPDGTVFGSETPGKRSGRIILANGESECEIVEVQLGHFELLGLGCCSGSEGFGLFHDACFHGTAAFCSGSLP